jgi:NADPH-dependent ferric siderophore reductase
MPRIPKWLGDTMETIFSRMIVPVRVTRVEYIYPQLKKIIMKGDFTKAKYAPGNVIEFRVTDNDFRHYTISDFDTEKGICEMLVYLHRQGVGSRWIENLKAGDKLKLMGPGGKMSYQFPFKQHFVFGDETSLGLMICMGKAASENKQLFFGLVELEKEHLSWINFLNSENIQSTESSFKNPAQPAIDLLSQWKDYFDKNTDNTCFYLTGRARSIQQFRKFLLSKGVDSKKIKTEPYWAEGKKGL